MTTTFKAFGTGNIYNAQSMDLTGDEILLSSRSTSTVLYGYIPQWNIDFEMHGSFTYQTPITDGYSASGTYTVAYVYRDSYLREIDTYDQPVDWTLIGDFTYELGFFAGDDVFEGSATSDERDFIQGLAGNDQFYGHGDSSYGDFFHGGAGVDTAVYSGMKSTYTVAASQVWDYITDAEPRLDGVLVTDSVYSRDGIDMLVDVELLKFSDTTTLSEFNASALYRFYNTETSSHFYSGNLVEIEKVLTRYSQFQFEGAVFEKNTSTTDVLNVYRFYNTETGTHFFTANEAEVTHVRNAYAQYSYEGLAYQAYGQEVAGTTELYRFYNNVTGTHFYTASTEEMVSVRLNYSGVFSYEGVAYYVGQVG